MIFVTHVRVTKITCRSVTSDTRARPAEGHDPEKVRSSPPGPGRYEEVIQVAEKKVSPKKPAAKATKSAQKTAATRVTKKKTLKRAVHKRIV